MKTTQSKIRATPNTTPENWCVLLQQAYEKVGQITLQSGTIVDICQYSHLEFLSDHVFGYMTPDKETAEWMADITLQACDSILQGTSRSQLSKNSERLKEFTAAVNGSFLGTRVSVRNFGKHFPQFIDCTYYPYWTDIISYESYEFTRHQFQNFIKGVMLFYKPDIK